MTGYWQAAVLGVVQGITEFLPISSSGHLVLASRWFGWPDQGLHFDMAVHSGSIVAVLAVVWPAWGELDSASRRRLGAVLAVATLPVAIAGLLLAEWVELVARDPVWIGATSIVFAILLGAADRRRKPAGGGGLSAVGFRDAIWIGISQAFAILPGTSRSGVTMTAALATGLSREAAVRFSFLLAVPVSVLVALKLSYDLALSSSGAVEPVPWGVLSVGFVAAAVSAYGAIRALLRWVERVGFLPFVVYRLVLGALLLANVL